MLSARAVAEQVARAPDGRLLAHVVRVSGDIAAAEDALSHALVRALKTSPGAGVPDAHEAWLLTTAKRRALHAHRHSGVASRAVPDLLLQVSEDTEAAALPDRRLELLFACAHPAIDAPARTPLMLQVVLGLTAERIAAAFAEPKAALAQRHVRAKRKIKDAGVLFRVYAEEELPECLPDVLDAIYNEGMQVWEARETGVAHEALYVGDFLENAVLHKPKAKGLMGLMCHAEARRDAHGDCAPLSTQDTAFGLVRWCCARGAAAWGSPLAPIRALPIGGSHPVGPCKPPFWETSGCGCVAGALRCIPGHRPEPWRSGQQGLGVDRG